ncbi:MAG: hypothetical protein ACTSRN_01075 [Alphaproteobacteria bacterium]
MLKKFFGLVVVGVVLIGCNNSQPVGGQGYFDAPMSVPTQQEPIFLVPQDTGVETDMTTSLSNAVEAAIATSVGTEVAMAQTPTPTDPNNISTDDGSLDLNAETFAEQEAKRNAAAVALAAARDQLVIIEPGTLPEVMAGVNIAQFARTTRNAVGESLYRRPVIKNRFSSAECRKFRSADDAQRNFLANGGPEQDPLNLDPNGDGFACKWSPEVYRLLQ